MSRMLGDIVRDAVESQPDMEVVADLLDCASVPSVAHETHTDVVVVGRELSEMLDTRLLNQCGSYAVLALSKDGRKAFRYELRPACVQLSADGPDISARLLVEAIRSAARGLAR